MRAPALAVALLLVLLLASPRAGAEDFAAVGKVNKLIDVTEAPQLAPGDRGTFSFRFNSTYTEAMYNVSLNVSVYEYATIDGSRAVDSGWPYPYPQINETGTREFRWDRARVDPGTPTNAAINLSFPVITSADSDLMPHGSVFAQASYFLRFWLEFDGGTGANRTHYRFASRGFFTDAEWAAATDTNNTSPCTPPWCRGNLNLTILGVDGILPDSAFGVLEPIPRWPFYLLIALAVFFLVLAFLYWVEENPGSYPRVEAWWARTRGRLRRALPARRRSRAPKE